MATYIFQNRSCSMNFAYVAHDYTEALACLSDEMEMNGLTVQPKQEMVCDLTHENNYVDTLTCSKM